MDKKIGVYVCKGCGIGECLDTDTLTQIATQEYRAPVVKTSVAFCLEDAQRIREDIEKDGVNTVVIAACSPRVNTDVFSFEGATVERVNIREQVAWSHPAGHEETQALSNDSLRMGIVRAQKLRLPTPYTEANERTILVVGGGITGLTAALDAAKAGYRVFLIEKESALGGFAAKLYKQFPKHPPYRDLEETGIQALIDEVERHPNIEVLKGATVSKASGEPGRYAVSVQVNGSVRELTAGAVVQATGWKPYDPAKFERYGFGRCRNVVTNVMVEEMASKGTITRPSDSWPAKTVLILQCAGTADEEHFPYSSNVTCLASLKQALYVRQQNPNAIVYFVYRDMQTPGQHEYFYKRVQEDPGVLFTCGEVKSVTEDAQKNLLVELWGTAIGGAVQLKADLVILATGMMPVAVESDGLNLEYLQGKGLPTTKFGFAESNFLCFPYETRRTGIYSAGCVKTTMDLAGSATDGTGAALKAIQSIALSSAGAAVHPRVNDLSFPSIFLQNCTKCGRCSQECPFGAIELTPEKNTPFVVTNRCRRCGVCMGACPVQIISFDDYSVDMVLGMIKAVEVPEGDEEKPRILALACENDAYPALDMAGINRLQWPASFRVVPVRCLGSVNTIMVADAFSKGFDGVVLLGCKAGDDYQCHFIQGSELLGTRMNNVRETLNQLMLDPDRAQVMTVEISEYNELPARLNAFVESIKAIGLNPMKGF
jgi:quinone-modifying oxidoreductase subunit QmoB